MRIDRKHAVVLGGSMAGLGAARALANHFERVTIVERDELPTDSVNRRGVPQGQHGHGVTPYGFRVLSHYFPTIMDELVADGALRGDLTGDFLWHQFGSWKLRANSGLELILAKRPHLERRVRENVLALNKITLLQGHDVEEPVFDPGTQSVRGVRVKNRTTGDLAALEADFVVDALGRSSPSPKWLASWGCGEVRESNVVVDVGYATAEFQRRPGDLYDSFGAIIGCTPPHSTRNGAILATETNGWIVTLVGCLRDYPPTDLAGWREFSRSLPTSEIFDLVKDREPLGPVVAFRFPANRRRHYEKLAKYPRGYLVTGDALCSFNPVYGQGMSVAFSDARALDDCLAAGDDDLAMRFFRKAAPVIDAAWAVATGEDFRFPQVEGRRPPGFGFVSRYLAQANRAARKDVVVLKQLFQVIGLVAPPSSMLAPGIAWRVLVGGLGWRRKSSAQKVARGGRGQGHQETRRRADRAKLDAVG